jgi:hypothetical protein
VLADLGAKTVSDRTIQRHLDQIGPGNHRDVVAEKCFTYATDCGGLSLLLYDVTTLLCRRHNRVYADLSVMPMFRVAAQVIPEGAGPVKTTAGFAFACFGAP